MKNEIYDAGLPYERFIKMGPDALTDEELVAIILRTGTKGEDALALSKKVLLLSKGKEGIIGLHHLSLKQLTGVKGIGIVKAVKLKAIAELSNRMALARLNNQSTIRCPQDIANLYMESMRHLEKENLRAVYMDSKDSMLSDNLISVGTLNCALVSVREIFRQALLINAASFILVHNHPSGDPTASREDIMLTKKVVKAAEFMEVRFLDHIIIGDQIFTSLKEKGVL